jgi:UDP-N-acetylmuramoyl-tripeptide--D-alanyl-D-alanine ligase
MDDSYNANPVSMQAALETLALLNGNRRIAILGDMNELGEFSVSEHALLGKSLKRYGITRSIFIGRYAEAAAAEARTSGSDASAFASVEDIEPELWRFISEGDAVLVKGSRSMKLERVVEQLKKAFA